MGCLLCLGPGSSPCPPCMGWHPQTAAGSFQLCKEGKGLLGTEAMAKCEGGQGTQLPARATTCYFNLSKQPELVNVTPARAQNPISSPLPALSTVCKLSTIHSPSQARSSLFSSWFFSCTPYKRSTAVVLALRLHRSYSKVHNVFLAFKMLFISCNPRREPASCCQLN